MLLYKRLINLLSSASADIVLKIVSELINSQRSVVHCVPAVAVFSRTSNSGDDCLKRIKKVCVLCVMLIAESILHSLDSLSSARIYE